MWIANGSRSLAGKQERTRMTPSPVTIQTSTESVPSVPGWFGEVVLLTAHLQKHGVLTRIAEQVRFARKRFGQYEMIDFLVVQIALCHQWRTHPGGVLRAAPAFCGLFHGLVLSVTNSLPAQRSHAFWRR
jgi:hypothetical protein